jgi:hypothetical protein
VTPNKEKLAKRLLKEESKWDGKYPIPMTWFEGGRIEDLGAVDLVLISEEDKCCWIANAVSAMVLYLKGYCVVKDPKILAKRKEFTK